MEYRISTAGRERMKAQAVHSEVKCPERLKMHRLTSESRASSGTFSGKMS